MMRKNKGGQVSFEYIVLFAFGLLLFIIVGSLVVVGLNRVKSIEGDSKDLADQLKAEIITASLSPSDYTASFALPGSIAGRPYWVNIYENPDNFVLVTVNNGGDLKKAGRAFIPIVDSAPSGDIPPKSVLTISKTGNVLNVVVTS